MTIKCHKLIAHVHTYNTRTLLTSTHNPPQAEREAIADEESSYALRSNRRSRDPAPPSRTKRDVKVITVCIYHRLP